MTACLMDPFERCGGVELLDCLFTKSVEMKVVYDHYIESLAANSETGSKMP